MGCRAIAMLRNWEVMQLKCRARKKSRKWHFPRKCHRNTFSVWFCMGVLGGWLKKVMNFDNVQSCVRCFTDWITFGKFKLDQVGIGLDELGGVEFGRDRF